MYIGRRCTEHLKIKSRVMAVYRDASIKRPLLLNAPSNRRPLSRGAFIRNILLSLYYLLDGVLIKLLESAVVFVLSKNIRVASYLKFYFAE